MRRLIAMLITCCLCLSLVPAAVFADDGGDSGEVCNLLVIGDSTSNGFGMPDNITENKSYAPGNGDLEGSWKLEDALEYNKNHPDAKLGRISNQSYPWRLKKYIETKEGVSCNLTPLCFDGMMSSNIRAMMDPEYYYKIIAKEREITGDVGEGPVDMNVSIFMQNLYNGSTIPEKTYEAMNQYTVAEVKKADVIVLDVCMNSFSFYLLRRITGIIGFDLAGGMKFHLEKVSDIDDLSDKNRSRLKVLKKEILDYIGNPEDPLTEEVLESVLFAFADCITSFSEDVKIIRKLNPDAKIIVPGVYKAMRGDKLSIGGKEVDLNALNEMLARSINVYLRALDDNCPNYYFADTPLDIHNIGAQIKEVENYEEFLKTETGKHYLEFNYDLMGGALMDLFPEGTPEEEKKEKIEGLFADAMRNYPINIAAFATGTGSDMGKVFMELGLYFATGVYPSADTMTHVHAMAASLVLHPSPIGCTQRFEAVRDAYDKDLTAYEEVLVDVVDAVKAGAASVGIKDISDIQKIIALKDLTSLITKEELLKMAMSIYELPDLEEEIREYMDEHSGTAEAETQDRIATLEAQVKELTDLIEELTKGDPEKKVTIAKVKIKSVKSAKRALTVKWKAVKNASGYKVYYKTSGKKAVVKTVKGAKKLTLKLTGLKKKAKYTVKVRAYRTADGKTMYGKWSAVKKPKTK